jgi:hypothetical protein
VVARVGGIRFPGGIAFASGADKMFVSDERGEPDVVIDARTTTRCRAASWRYRPERTCNPAGDDTRIGNRGVRRRAAAMSSAPISGYRRSLFD